MYQHKECRHSDGEVPFGLITPVPSDIQLQNPFKQMETSKHHMHIQTYNLFKLTVKEESSKHY